MTKYICKKCNNERMLEKATIIVLNGMVVVKEALCGFKGCDEFMVSEPTDGMPGLIRTEPTLKKN